MTHPYVFRISVAFVFSLFNYLLVDYVAPPETQNFFLLALTSFNGIMMLGLLLLPPQVNLKSVLSLCVMALLYAYAFSYPLHYELDDGYGILWVAQAQVSLFIAFCFFYSFFKSNNFQYASLFSHSWRILLSVLLAGSFSGLVWSLLLLATFLFSLLGFTWVRDLVFSKEMLLIGNPIFFAIGLSLLSEFEGIINKCRDILLSFSTVLYPLLMSIGLLYLVVIPFAHKPLEDLWLSLYLLALFNLFVFNCVHQGGRQTSPYPKWINAVIGLFFILIPFYLIYAISYPVLEMNAGKLSVGTLYSTLVGVILFAYAITYAISYFIPKQKAAWLAGLSSVNKVMAVIVAVLFFLMATPVLDLASWVPVQ